MRVLEGVMRKRMYCEERGREGREKQSRGWRVSIWLGTQTCCNAVYLAHRAYHGVVLRESDGRRTRRGEDGQSTVAWTITAPPCHCTHHLLPSFDGGIDLEGVCGRGRDKRE